MNTDDNEGTVLPSLHRICLGVVSDFVDLSMFIYQ